ncbi:hypothetical protein G7054_g10827 [Neopestalotiopsis clavispora]|nr:hypothetical protein G7054_g10827 [Neopestalotiopsis clavispora]
MLVLATGDATSVALQGFLRTDWGFLAAIACFDLNIVINMASVAAGLRSTYRCIFHFSICLFWNATSRLAHTPILFVFEIVPWVAAVLTIMDLFITNKPDTNILLRPSDPGLLGKLSFSWLSPIIFSQEPLQLDDLPEINLPDVFGGYQKRFLETFFRSLGALTQSVWFFLYKEHMSELVVASVMRLIEDITRLILALLLRELIAQPRLDIVMAQFCLLFVGSLCGNYGRYRTRYVAVRYRTMLSAAIHDKTLRLGDSPKDGGLDVSTLSEIDLQTILQNVFNMFDLWSCPLQIFLCLGGIFYLLSWKAFLGVVLVTILMFPTLAAVAGKLGQRIRRYMVARDARGKITNEALSSILSIKMHGWEPAFVRIISDRRSEELRLQAAQANWNALLVVLMQSTPCLITVAAFGICLATNVLLDAKTIFTAIFLFTMLNGSLMQLSSSVSSLQVLRSSMGRIYTFLSQTEGNTEPSTPIQTSVSETDEGIKVKNMTVGWPQHSPILSGASLLIKNNALTVLSGPTAAGKSSTLIHILRALEEAPLRGRLKVSYCPQQPFLVDGTIRQNIVFGKPFEQELYKRVVRACALETDFAALAYGDRTIISGSTTLSGGQMARIGLARAAYSQADVVVLDDPLAAIDARNEKKIVQDLLSCDGILKNCAKLVSSNSQSVLNAADAVFGIDQYLKRLQPISKANSTPLSTTIQESQFADKRKCPVVHVAKVPSESPAINAFVGQQTSAAPLKVEDEAVPQRSHPIWSYVAGARKHGWAATIFLLCSARISSVISVYLLKSLASNQGRAVSVRGLVGFAGMSMLQLVEFFFFIYLLYHLCIIPSATKTHSRLIAGVLMRSREFFEKRTIGDIMALFTTDLGRIDGSLTGTMVSMLAQYANLVLACGVLVVSFPASISFVILLFYVFTSLQQFYLTKLRELRHLDASSRSPLLTYLEQSRSGRVLFNAYKISDQRVGGFHSLLRQNLQALLPLVMTDVWLGLRLDILATMMQMTSIALLIASGVDASTLGLTATYVFTISGSLNTIARTRALFEADAVSLARVNVYAYPYLDEAAKRTIIHTTTAGRDAELPGPDQVSGFDQSESLLVPARAWPEKGKIVFKEVSARYDPGLPDCLSGINFTIEPGQKVAVIGSTGSGKSSTLLCILGLLDQVRGSIEIDGIKILKMHDLMTLRHGLGLIPQNPTMFSSTVRLNMDPLVQHGDDHIMTALRRSGAADILTGILKQKFGNPSCEDVQIQQASILDMELNTNVKLSKGEQQLFAIARAMLANSKILLLDEGAT